MLSLPQIRSGQAGLAISAKKPPDLRCVCVLGCAGMELLLPSTCGMHQSGLLHTHPARNRCLKEKSSSLVVQESERKKSLEVFLHHGTSQLLSRHYFPPLQLELSHKKSLTPKRDETPHRILNPKSGQEIQPQQTFGINGHKSLISSGMCLHCLPHHRGALGITSCR